MYSSSKSVAVGVFCVDGFLFDDLGDMTQYESFSSAAMSSSGLYELWLLGLVMPPVVTTELESEVIMTSASAADGRLEVVDEAGASDVEV